MTETDDIHSDSAKDVAAKLAQLDEKLHVEEKIKDGAENLLQVRCMCRVICNLKPPRFYRSSIQLNQIIRKCLGGKLKKHSLKQTTI